MNEFEERLHDMLQERGSQPVATPQAPSKVLRKTRRRQMSTALTAIDGAAIGTSTSRVSRPVPAPKLRAASR